MGIEWTDEQKKAIGLRDCNLIVAAAAGSGKTAVLVERIVQIVEGGIDIDSLLITTFTEAAAKKMKQEIGDEIKKRLASNPASKHLARQLVLLSRADICTIDSFCMRVVRSNFHKIDIEPDFKIADQNEGELLLVQAVDEIFGEMYEAENDDFYNLLECYATQRDDNALRDALLSLCQFVRSMPDSRAWLRDCADMYGGIEGIFESKWGALAYESTKIELDGCIQNVRDAYEYACQAEQMNSYAVPLQNDLAALLDIKEALSGKDFNSVCKKINAFSPAGGGRAKPKTPDEVKQPIAERREYVKKHMTALTEKFYYASEAEIRAEAEYAAKQVRALCTLAELIDERFLEIKKKRGVLDFADVEIMALDILTDTDEDGNKCASEAALNLRDKYYMILVDEYQDSNALQEAIFERISRGNNIFMVGDIKQSIYRFRHTNPLLFKSKKDTYSDSEGINRRVIMSQNFRSRRDIIEAVNFIMRQSVSPLVGEIIYDETEELNAGAKNYPEAENAGGAVEVHVLGEAEDGETDGNEEGLLGAAAEADRVARRILQLKRDGFEVFDKKTDGMRKMKYSDIAILMRSPSVDAPIFVDTLSRYGIPVFSDADGGYFATEQIELMLSLLSVIDNPMQDIKLLSVMRSQIGGFRDTELLDIRMCNSKSDIYGAVCACAKADTPLGKRCGEFLEKIDTWRKKSRHMPVHELIWYLYDDTGYYDIAAAADESGRSKANLNLLAEYARSYEKTSFKGLFSFINYAERIKNANKDFGSAKTLGEGQDTVRIMSMHKSKGLEFSVVFAVRLAKSFNRMDLSGKLLLHSELGIGVDFIDVQNRYKYPTFIKRAVKEKLYYELLSEEIRVLYVALTRAKEKLIITLAPTNPETKKKKWLSGAQAASGNPLPVFYTAAASGMADWLMGALLCHEAGREYAQMHISCPESNARFKLYFGNAFEAAVCEGKIPTDTESASETVDYSRVIDDALGYSYSKDGAVSVPTKVSVTEMKRIINNEIDISQANLYAQELISTPSFMNGGKTFGGADRGNAFHFVMQKLDLSLPLDEAGIKQQLNLMLTEQIAKKEQLDAVDIKKIERFFATELGKRMLQSERAVREAPFEIPIDAAEDLGISNAYGESVLLQGIIDCYFYEGDGIVLLDYKTDSVRSEADIAKIKEKYRLQLTLYEKALEKITKMKVKSKYLYLFSCEAVVQC